MNAHWSSSFPNLDSDEIFSTGVSTVEHRVTKEAGIVSKSNEQALEASIEKYLTGTCLEEQSAIRDGVTELPLALTTATTGQRLGFQYPLCRG